MEVDLPQYRQSLIATFSACPGSAKRSLEDVRRTPSEMAARGTLVHRFVHQASKEMREHGWTTYPIEMGMELISKIICQQDVPSEEVVPLSMWQLKWTRVICALWCERVSFDARLMVAAEERFYADLELPIGETVRVTGQLDLLLGDPPGGLLIKDFKSGFKHPVQPKEPEKAEIEGSALTTLGWAQGVIYTFLVFENFPSYDRVIFEEENLLWNEKRRMRTERWQMERFRDTLAGEVALLHQAVQSGLGSARWPETAGPHCALCANPGTCPVLRQEDYEIETPKGRRRVAEDWIKTKETAKRIRYILDGLVDDHGPIEIVSNGEVYHVGWDYSTGKRNFKMFKAPDIPPSAYDEVIVKKARDAGVLADG